MLTKFQGHQIELSNRTPDDHPETLLKLQLPVNLSWESPLHADIETEFVDIRHLAVLLLPSGIQ